MVKNHQIIAKKSELFIRRVQTLTAHLRHEERSSSDGEYYE